MRGFIITASLCVAHPLCICASVFVWACLLHPSGIPLVLQLQCPQAIKNDEKQTTLLFFFISLWNNSTSLGPTVDHGYISAQGYRQMTENGQIWWIEWGFANCFSLDAVSNPLFSPNSVISHDCLFVEQVKNRIYGESACNLNKI